MEEDYYEWYVREFVGNDVEKMKTEYFRLVDEYKSTKKILCSIGRYSAKNILITNNGSKVIFDSDS